MLDLITNYDEIQHQNFLNLREVRNFLALPKTLDLEINSDSAFQFKMIMHTPNSLFHIRKYIDKNEVTQLVGIGDVYRLNSNDGDFDIVTTVLVHPHYRKNGIATEILNDILHHDEFKSYERMRFTISKHSNIYLKPTLKRWKFKKLIEDYQYIEYSVDIPILRSYLEHKSASKEIMNQGFKTIYDLIDYLHSKNCEITYELYPNQHIRFLSELNETEVSIVEIYNIWKQHSKDYIELICEKRKDSSGEIYHMFDISPEVCIDTQCTDDLYLRYKYNKSVEEYTWKTQEDLMKFIFINGTLC